MSGTLRKPGVIAQLLARPQQYCWRQAVHLLLGWLQQQGVPPETALLHMLRFDNSISPAFPASQIEALGIEEELGNAALLQVHITPTFMGLLGNHGALPSHYSERLASHQASAHDYAPRAFLDLFSSRALVLFYQAREKYRIEQGIASQQFLPHLLALAGRHGATCGNIAPSVIGLYSGLQQQRHLSATAMARILTDHFNVPVTVREATGTMLTLAPREQTALGGANAVLGQRSLAGARSLRPDLAITIRIGPLSAKRHASFLPGASASGQLLQLMRLLGQPWLQIQVVLVLRADDVRGVTLDRRSEGGLGCDSFLAAPVRKSDRDDMHYHLQLMLPFND